MAVRKSDPCPDCAGTGTVTAYTRDSDGELTVTSDVTCPRCAGIGTPPVAVALHPKDV